MWFFKKKKAKVTEQTQEKGAQGRFLLYTVCAEGDNAQTCRLNSMAGEIVYAQKQGYTSKEYHEIVSRAKEYQFFVQKDEDDSLGKAGNYFLELDKENLVVKDGELYGVLVYSRAYAGCNEDGDVDKYCNVVITLSHCGRLVTTQYNQWDNGSTRVHTLIKRDSVLCKVACEQSDRATYYFLEGQERGVYLEERWLTAAEYALVKKEVEKYVLSFECEDETRNYSMDVNSKMAVVQDGVFLGIETWFEDDERGNYGIILTPSSGKITVNARKYRSSFDYENVKTATLVLKK